MKYVVNHLIPAKRSDAASIADRFISAAGLDVTSTNKMVPIANGGMSAKRLDGQMIVSHLPVKWRNFPFFVTLRALNPDCEIIHVEHAAGQLHKEASVEASISSGVSVPHRSKSLMRSTYALFDRVVSASGEQAVWLDHQGLVLCPHAHIVHTLRSEHDDL